MHRIKKLKLKDFINSNRSKSHNYKYMKEKNSERCKMLLDNPRDIHKSENQLVLNIRAHETFVINQKLKKNIQKNLKCKKVNVYFI